MHVTITHKIDLLSRVTTVEQNFVWINFRQTDLFCMFLRYKFSQKFTKLRNLILQKI